MVDDQEIKNLPSFIFGSFSQRLAAYLIDVFLINAITSLLLNSYQLAGYQPKSGNFTLFNLTNVVIYFVYFVLLTKCNKGQTIGKMIFGLRVFSIYEKNLSWADVLYRELVGRYIQKKVKIFYLLLFLTNQKQTMADLVTDTVVVSENKYFDLNEYLLINKNESVKVE